MESAHSNKELWALVHESVLDKVPTKDNCQKKEVIEANNLQYQKEGLSVVVVGASGDLAKKKTYPALLALFLNGLLPEHAIIFGYARSAKTHEEIREQIRPYLKGGSDCIERFLSKCFYKQGSYSSQEAMADLISELEAHEAEAGFLVANRVFYFAIPPNVFIETAASIKAKGMSPTGWTRLIVEKPFGHDLASAEQLAAQLNSYFAESYIYRIDHYLGKEMVQNLLVLRFGNIMFEQIWNRQHVSSVLITFKEPFGTEGRGGYFDRYGIVRDIMQNHLMQVLALVAMEPPVKAAGLGTANYVRDEKVKVLNCIDPIELDNTVLGQYVADEEEKNPGYLDDETVPQGSITPTFASMVMYINNQRWQGVPFILKAGKALNEAKAEIRVQYHPTPAAMHMFDGQPCPRNELVIVLQPEETIYFKTNVKAPGLRTAPLQTELDLTYESRFPGLFNPDAYTRLILDVLRGEQSTFVREDELKAAWRIFDPVIKRMEREKIQPLPYKYGSRGPKEADDLRESVGYVYDSSYEWHRKQRQSQVHKK